MNFQQRQNSQTLFFQGLLRLSMIATVGFCGAVALAQSGSRGAPINGGGNRVGSVTQPAQSFQQSRAIFPSPSFANSLQENFGPSQNFPPTQSSVTNQSFATPNLLSAYDALPLDQPAARSNVQSPAVGIPQASLVDAVFEMHDPFSPYAIDHSPWDCFLRRYLVTGPNGVNRIKYRQVTATDRQQLECYLNRLQTTNISAFNRDEQLAFWFNMYNAKTISIVLQNYPVRSVRQIKENFTDFVGPFDDQGVVSVLGKPLSLNDIESGIIRPIWKDPRIHYAVNCASYGCPNLSPTAWTAADLDARLDAAACNFINSGRAVRSGFGGVRLSKIYKWYKDDFGGNDESVLAHVRRYASGQTANALCNHASIAGYFYDWSLNDAKVTRSRLLESWRR